MKVASIAAADYKPKYIYSMPFASKEAFNWEESLQLNRSQTKLPVDRNKFSFSGEIGIHIPKNNEQNQMHLHNVRWRWKYSPDNLLVRLPTTTENILIKYIRISQSQQKRNHSQPRWATEGREESIESASTEPPRMTFSPVSTAFASIFEPAKNCSKTNQLSKMPHKKQSPSKQEIVSSVLFTTETTVVPDKQKKQIGGNISPDLAMLYNQAQTTRWKSK